jgi:DNA polymerase III epsilon subunit-like protein
MSTQKRSKPGEREAYICVDVETAGPVPGDYSLLSIGACTLDEPPATFYVELKPVNDHLTSEAAKVHQLSMEHLRVEGMEPKEALLQLEAWLKEQVGAKQEAVFVAFNAAFDWMFINYYFMHYLGYNPFGHAALDIKALYMGLAKVPWYKTSWRFIDPQFVERPSLTHHALQDALDQASLFRKLLAEINQLK